MIQATRDLHPGWRLSPQDVQRQAVPRGSGHPLSFRDETEVIGHVLVAPVYKGEALLLPDVASATVGGPLAVQLLPGERAIFVPWPLAVGFAVEPGDSVDLVAVWDRFEPGRGTEAISAARVLQRHDDDFGAGGLVVAVPAVAAGAVVAAIEHGSLHPLVRPLTEP